MSSTSPIASVSGFLHEKLENSTAIKNEDSKINHLKITARVIGAAALLLANTIETALRHLVAYAAKAISFALKGDQKEAFAEDYLNPAFEHASLNKDKFHKIKDDLLLQYDTHMEPFLNNKVSPPQV